MSTINSILLTYLNLISIAVSFDLNPISINHRNNQFSSRELFSKHNMAEGIQNEDLQKMTTLDWIDMDSFRESFSPSDLCPEYPSTGNPRLAKDFDYASAVLDAWENDIVAYKNLPTPSNKTVGARIEYKRKSDDTNLSGYLVAKSTFILDSQKNQNGSTKLLPVIILFHTGAGPQDIFLRWKADMLVRDNIWGDDGCVVFIADIVSDSTGWTWTDRDKYDSTRKSLLQYTTREADGVMKRWLLRQTIEAILDTLKLFDKVDNDRIAAMGWCMGGHPILELSTMEVDGVKVLITFHGVFDGILENDGNDDSIKDHNKSVLICNGLSDPFVSNDSLQFGKSVFERNYWNVEVLNFDNVKHGFTNPAQDFNPSENFAFDKYAADCSWEATRMLLKRQLLSKN